MTIHQISEAASARQWREDTMRLTRAELSKLIGLSVSTVADYEAGHHRSKGTPIAPEEWTRYRLICAALTAGLDFDWKTCRVTVTMKRSFDVMPG